MTGRSNVQLDCIAGHRKVAVASDELLVDLEDPHPIWTKPWVPEPRDDFFGVKWPVITEGSAVERCDCLRIFFSERAQNRLSHALAHGPKVRHR